VYEAEISRERAEVEENPEEEIEEMSLFYQLQGFTPEESQKMAERLAEQPEQFVQAMAQSELGLSEHRFPNQWTAALSAGISTAIGAFVPIIPFFFSGGFDAVIASFGISLGAHFAIGALKSLITMRSWWASGSGDDLDWRHRRRRHVRAGTCVWRFGLRPHASLERVCCGFEYLAAYLVCVPSAQGARTPKQIRLDRCNRIPVSEVTNYRRVRMRTRYAKKCLSDLFWNHRRSRRFDRMVELPSSRCV
jgi:hypothetical protein